MFALLTGLPGWAEILALLFVGVLIFGKRLPDVGRNIGRGIVEFKKGLRGIEDEMDHTVEGEAPPKQIDQDHESDVSIENKSSTRATSEHSSNPGS